MSSIPTRGNEIYKLNLRHCGATQNAMLPEFRGKLEAECFNTRLPCGIQREVLKKTIFTVLKRTQVAAGHQYLKC